MGYSIAIRLFTCLVFIAVEFLQPVSSVFAAQNNLSLPVPGVRVSVSPPFNPAILKGIKVHPDNPFKFDFILDPGDDGVIARSEATKQSFLKEESSRLIKYFLASLTIPEKDLWVNLSPYEKDRIVPEAFGQTEMGRDLLAQDYLLKQITASLMYPEDEVGKKFWKRIYEEAAKKYGNTNLPINTFNKVWIVPEKAVVYENAKAGTAYVVESKLKVMLEQDYVAMQHNRSGEPVEPTDYLSQEKHSSVIARNEETKQSFSSQIIRDIIIPELTKEVNEGKNFAQLRQVYQSLILAAWYKKKIKQSILSQVYSDKNKTAGVEYTQSVIASVAKQSNNQKTSNDTEGIYQRYLQAFKKGTYNYIKEEQDPIMQKSTTRKYFSGGITNLATNLKINKIDDFAMLGILRSLVNKVRIVTARVNPLQDVDEAMSSNPLKSLSSYNGDLKRFIQNTLTKRYSAWGLSFDLADRIVGILAQHTDDIQEARKSVYREVIDFKTNDAWQAAYGRYKQATKYESTYKQISSRIANLPKGAVILDWGAGNNALGETIVNNMPGVSVIGVDVMDYHEDASTPNLRYFKQDNPTKVPFVEDHSVDVISMNAVFHHIADDLVDDVLKEVRRVLKPGGRLILIEDTYSTEMALNGLADTEITKQFLELVRLHGDQFAKDFFMFNDWYSNIVVHYWDGMALPYRFRSIEEWNELLKTKGFMSTYVSHLGFPEKGFHKPDLGILEFAPDNAVNVAEVDDKAMKVNKPRIIPVESLIKLASVDSDTRQSVAFGFKGESLDEANDLIDNLIKPDGVKEAEVEFQQLKRRGKLNSDKDFDPFIARRLARIASAYAIQYLFQKDSILEIKYEEMIKTRIIREVREWQKANNISDAYQDQRVKGGTEEEKLLINRFHLGHTVESIPEEFSLLENMRLFYLARARNKNDKGVGFTPDLDTWVFQSLETMIPRKLFSPKMQQIIFPNGVDHAQLTNSNKDSDFAMKSKPIAISANFSNIKGAPLEKYKTPQDFLKKYNFIPQVIDVELPVAMQAITQLLKIRQDQARQIIIWQNLSLGEMYPFFSKDLKKAMGVYEIRDFEGSLAKWNADPSKIPAALRKANFILVKVKQASTLSHFNRTLGNGMLPLDAVNKLSRILDAPVVMVDSSRRDLSRAQQEVKKNKGNEWFYLNPTVETPGYVESSFEVHDLFLSNDSAKDLIIVMAGKKVHASRVARNVFGARIEEAVLNSNDSMLLTLKNKLKNIKQSRKVIDKESKSRRSLPDLAMNVSQNDLNITELIKKGFVEYTNNNHRLLFILKHGVDSFNDSAYAIEIYDLQSSQRSRVGYITISIVGENVFLNDAIDLSRLDSDSDVAVKEAKRAYGLVDEKIPKAFKIYGLWLSHQYVNGGELGLESLGNTMVACALIYAKERGMKSLFIKPTNQMTGYYKKRFQAKENMMNVFTFYSLIIDLNNISIRGLKIVDKGFEGIFVRKEAQESVEAQAVVKRSGEENGNDVTHGGINFNMNKINLNTNTSSVIDFNIDPAMIQQLRNVAGFIPVIINIQPMTDVEMFLNK